MPAISIIIPVFNKWHYTEVCIESLKETIDDSIVEVIVVDNGSTDSTMLEMEKLTSQHMWLKYIKNNENLGFAKACNVGALSSNSEYLLFLNNDTKLLPGWLEPLLFVLDTDREVAVVGSKLLFEDNTIQHAGVVMIVDADMTERQLFGRHINYGAHFRYPNAQVSMVYPVVTGACLLIRRTVFEEVGGFDTEYWNGYEDVDLCLAVGEQGKKIVYVPESILYHYESKSGEQRFIKTKHNEERLKQKWLAKSVHNYVNNMTDRTVVEVQGKSPYRYYYNTIAVIVPHYGELKYLALFVESLKLSFDRSIELIVINNSGDEDSRVYLENLKKEFPLMKVITPEHNLGFPKSINEGLRMANSKYILIANNDIVLPPNTLTRLLNTLESDRDFGMVGPVANSVSGLQMVHDAAYSNLDEMRSYAERRFATMSKAQRVFPRIAFLCTLIKREVIEKIGLLDERFTPGNFEDDDYCLRVQLAGYKTVIDDSVFVHHFGSVNFKKDGNSAYMQLIETNKKKFVEKWGADPNQLWLENRAPKKNSIQIFSSFNKIEDYLKTAAEFLKQGDYEGALYYYSDSLRYLENSSEYKTQFEQVTNLVKKLSELINKVNS